MTKWISYMYTYIPFLLSLPPNPSRPFRSSQSAELSSLCHTVASHWLSNLHMVVWVGEIPWRWKCQPAQVLLPGESHVQRSLVGYSPWDRKRAGHDLTTEQQQLSVYISMLLSIHPPASLLCPQVFSLCLCLSIHYWWFMLSHWIVTTLWGERKQLLRVTVLGWCGWVRPVKHKGAMISSWTGMWQRLRVTGPESTREMRGCAWGHTAGGVVKGLLPAVCMLLSPHPLLHNNNLHYFWNWGLVALQCCVSAVQQSESAVHIHVSSLCPTHTQNVHCFLLLPSGC